MSSLLGRVRSKSQQNSLFSKLQTFGAENWARKISKYLPQVLLQKLYFVFNVPKQGWDFSSEKFGP